MSDRFLDLVASGFIALFLRVPLINHICYLFRSLAVRFILSQSCSVLTFFICGVPVLGTILLVLILNDIDNAG